MRYLLRHRIAIGRPVTYMDATHLTVAERAPYVSIARAYGCDLEAVFFDVPLEVCQARNRRRHESFRKKQSRRCRPGWFRRALKRDSAASR